MRKEADGDPVRTEKRTDRAACHDEHGFAGLLWPAIWPLLALASVNEANAAFFRGLLNSVTKGADRAPPAPQWASHHAVRLELPTMHLRDFSLSSQGNATLICAPYALHGATVADFAPGHSVVAALQSAGIERLFVTDWRSASADMRYFSIDTYLAELNVAVDELGSPVDLVGLCQGGWMALIFAARFPEKVRKLVLVGAPVDIHSGESWLSRLAGNVQLDVFRNLVELGNGRVSGQRMQAYWEPALAAEDAYRVLQISPNDNAGAAELEERFFNWNAWTVDLPGTYYLEVVERLYKNNEIARGQFVALGHRADLARVHTPLFLLAAAHDELIAPEQIFAAADLVGTPKASITKVTEPCGHLSLFLGRRVLEESWRAIGNWLRSSATPHVPAIVRREASA